MPSPLSRYFLLFVLMLSASPGFAFEPLQKSFDATPQESTSSLNVDDIEFTSDDLRKAESLTVTPAAPGEKGRAPKGYSLLDVGF